MSRALPILFNADMVRAILDGRKTVTRRVMKPANPFRNKEGYCQGNGLWVDGYNKNDEPNGHIKDYSVSSCWMTKKYYIGKYAPYQPGDILYVRETWKIVDYLDKLSLKFEYEADGKISDFIDFTSDRLQKFLKYISKRDGALPYSCQRKPPVSG